MTSQVGIYNIAIGKLGSSNRVTDPLDDTRNARALSAVYEAKRDLELASHPWTFAMARAQIPALVGAPIFGWSKKFPRPAGLLSLVEIGECFVLYDTGAGPGFELEGANILCDETSPLNIRYTQQITNTGLFHPCFVELLACRLAFETCKEITGSTDMRSQLWQERTAALQEARRQNAIEKPPQQPIRGSWFNALHGTGG